MYREFEKVIGYQFKNTEYLTIALTHSSYANETREPVQNNERQEFLGDAVLSIVVSDYLFNRFHLAEGDLTKLRAALVCEKGLFAMAQKIELGKQLRLGRGEELMGGRERPSVVSDAFEALIAAIERFLQLPLETRAEMGKAARRKMEKEFSRQRVVDIYMREIEELVKP